jgi:hypothetical protein
MEWLLLMVVLAVPLLLNILAIVSYRGTFRIGAVLVLPIIAFASLGDIYSASQHGNLTGLLTMLVAAPALVVLLLLGLGNVVIRVKLRRPDHSSQIGTTVAEVVPRAVDQQKGFIYSRAVRWAIAGACLTISGLFLVALYRGPLFSGWHVLLNSPWHLVWPIAAAAFGAVGGAGLAWSSGWKERP